MLNIITIKPGHIQVESENYRKANLELIQTISDILENNTCLLLPHSEFPNMFVTAVGGYEQECAVGTVYSVQDCTCVPGGE